MDAATVAVLLLVVDWCCDESVSFDASNDDVGTLRPATVDRGIHALTTTTGTVQSAAVQVRSKILMMAIVKIDMYSS
jgi:hypothetical protein